VEDTVVCVGRDGDAQENSEVLFKLLAFHSHVNTLRQTSLNAVQ
jgi:hypothetical protein